MHKNILLIFYLIFPFFFPFLLEINIQDVFFSLFLCFVCKISMDCTGSLAV